MCPVMEGLFENSSWNCDRKKMDASWDGWGDASKIFSIAEEASENILKWVIVGYLMESLLTMDEACPSANISAS